MSSVPARLGVALLLPSVEEAPSRTWRMVEELAPALEARGHRVRMIAGGGAPAAAGLGVSRPRRVIEEALLARGFPSRLTRIPITLAALRGGDLNVIHTFSALDAQTALLARRLHGATAVFTCVEPPTRASLAERRLSLSIARRAFFESDAVVAADAAAKEAIERWLALEVEAVEGGDAAAHEAIYRGCLRRSP